MLSRVARSAVRGSSASRAAAAVAVPAGLSLLSSGACSPAGPRGLATEAGKPSGSKLWGGRFTGATDPLMERFNASIHFDKRLARADIEGSRAYAAALARAGLITDEEAATLRSGLERVLDEWTSGTFAIVEETDEDIHTANERRLGELVGSVAGKLHTGRSRNDQVATDVRLWLRDELSELERKIASLVGVMAGRAEAEVDVLMPGYTHLQPAQPIRWGHWLMSHAAALMRDADRIADVRRRVNVMPLGSGAIAGHPFGIDRHALAEDLGFDGVSSNSLDAVSDRDFIVETLFCASMTGLHLSRMAEDLILYSSAEFGFVKMSDAYSTGSSLMPQKKNPDAMELVRGKSGRPIGSLVTLMTAVKGLPSTYNKDLQEDKEPLFDTIDTMNGVVPICEGVLATLTIDEARMRASLHPSMLATDLADYLVRKGVPFRETHHVAGQAVQLAEERGVALTDLTADDLRPLHPLFEDDVERVWSFESSVESRDSDGGTGKRSVIAQVAAARRFVASVQG